MKLLIRLQLSVEYSILMRDLVDYVHRFEPFAFVRQQKSTLLIQQMIFDSRTYLNFVC